MANIQTRMLSPAEKTNIRLHMADYFLRCERSERLIHYKQKFRNTYGIPPESGFTADCSELTIDGSYWAWKHNTYGILVPDPSGNHYNGQGNTTSIRNNPENANHVPLNHKFFVGDMAQYRDSDHVTTCRLGGTIKTAIFTSHGKEAGPVPTQLWSYRRDELLYVIRPAILA